jgi:hypothetical protein
MTTTIDANSRTKPFVETNQHREFRTGVALYDGNPLIGALGPIRTRAEAIALHTPKVPYSPEERHLPIHLRPHAMRAMTLFNMPTTAQLAVDAEVELYIRAGYVQRNPVDAEFVRQMAEDMSYIEENKLPPPRYSTDLLGTCAAGCAGTGKTSSFRRAVSRYSKRITHRYEIDGRREGFYQVPVLHLELDHNASLQALGVAFFEALGEIVGKDLRTERGVDHAGESKMLPKIFTACREFHIGLIVLDEAQNMSRSSRGANHVIAYFVRLMNATGVPIALIGTDSVSGPLEKWMSMGRRFTGNVPLFAPFRLDALWIEFCTRLWANLYTAHPFDVAKHAARFHRITGGVPDLAKKLCFASQMMVFGREVECVDDVVLQETADTFFHFVRGQVAAIHAGKKAEGLELSLRDLEKHYKKLINEQCARLGLPPEYPDLACGIPAVTSDADGKSAGAVVPNEKPASKDSSPEAVKADASAASNAQSVLQPAAEDLDQSSAAIKARFKARQARK